MTTPTSSGQPTGAVKRENGELELEDGTRSPQQRSRARQLEEHSTETDAPTEAAGADPDDDLDDEPSV